MHRRCGSWPIRGQNPGRGYQVYAVARRVAASYARPMARAADDELRAEPTPPEPLSCVGAIHTDGRARTRVYEPDLPLVASSTPDLAEQADEHLTGFGER